MTSKQFITKALAGTTRATQCSSVFVSGQTVYSYGYHYPLVTIIGGKAFINSRGYSVTTGKHIGWAFSAAAELVGWDNCYHAPTTEGLHKQGIINGAKAELASIERQMDAKKRKDTRVFEWLQVQHDRMTSTLKAVEAI